MRIELAPMEGITSYIYRNALAKYYGGVDTYFSPFISTHKDKELNFKEKNEIRAENNSGLILVPQVLTANVDEFIYTSEKIKSFGYDHVNINFGCPSATVTTKGKGSGILQDNEKLDRLLYEIFSRTDIKVSVKTRLGYSDEGEWEDLLHIYEKYPLEELIVHARIREDFYNGDARVHALARYDMSKVTFSYNGDIFSVDDYIRITDTFEHMKAVMIGRGIIARPWLACRIKAETQKPLGDDEMNTGGISGISTPEGMNVFKEFLREVISGYDKIMPGEKNTLFKLKELWVYMIHPFEDGECYKDIDAKKLLKSIRKCNSLKELKVIINSL